MEDTLTDPLAEYTATEGNPEPEPLGATEQQLGAEATTEPGGSYVVKVNGEEREVTLDELRGGYMRQADYTQKTQDLANQRQQLEQWLMVEEAFQQDPAATVRALAQAYGVPLNAPQPAQQAQQQAVEYDEWGDPVGSVQPQQSTDSVLLQEIESLKSQIRSLTTTQAKEQISREAANLALKYPDVDPEVATRHAVANKFPSLELAFRDLAFENRSEAWETERKRREAEQQVIEAKRGAGVVNPGTNPAVNSVGSPTKDYSKMSFKDIFREVAADNGLNLENSNFIDY